ncbi:MAG TPA: glycosyltransferase family 39 protein, partial [Myxococcota bacterium]|nr:glycosyltransferase family 39 protein [Myxococcota bacterium]
QGQAVTDPTRELARGLVTKRHRDRVEVEVTPAHSGLTPERLTELAELCSRPLPKNPAEIPITPCMGREGRALDIMSESESFRLTGILAGGLAVMLTFLLGELMFGWLVALLGSLLFIFVPEHFFHGFMACFDMPIVALQMLTIYAFWRSLEDRRWALVAGLAWGLALLTKHNAFFVPFSLIVFWLWAGKDEFAVRWVGLREGLVRVQLPRFPLAFLVMPILGLTMLFAWWPRLWYDPLQSLRDWFGFHIHHEHYMQYWFGEPLQVPPFPISYPFEKTLLTYPEVLLVLLPIGTLFLVPPAAIRVYLTGLWAGLMARVRRTPRPARRSAPLSPSAKVAIFLLVNGLVPLLVIALPSTPIFGGIKHWMTGTPFLALVAAYGLFRLTAALRLPTWAAAMAAVLVIAHPIKSSIDNAWLGTNHYNTIFAGGLQGAADDKLMRIFWGHEARYAADWLNANAPLNARVYWQDATWGTYEMYQREGWLRHDIRYLGDYVGADIALNETLQALWEPDQRARRALDVA